MLSSKKNYQRGDHSSVNIAIWQYYWDKQHPCHGNILGQRGLIINHSLQWQPRVNAMDICGGKKNQILASRRKNWAKHYLDIKRQKDHRGKYHVTIILRTACRKYSDVEMWSHLVDNQTTLQESTVSDIQCVSILLCSLRGWTTNSSVWTKI